MRRLNAHGLCRLGVLALLGMTLSVALTSCGSSWKREVRFSHANIVVYVEHRLDDKTGEKIDFEYAHPIDVPAQKIAIILSQLTHTYNPWFQGPEALALFHPKEVGRYSEPIGESLKTLNSRERLRFLITHEQWTGFLMGVQATSGVMFVTTDGKFNLAFDRIRERVSTGESGRPEEVSFPIDPLAETNGSPLIPITGSQFHTDPKTHKPHRRWLEIDLAQVQSRAEAVQTSPAVQPPPTPTTPVQPPPAATPQPQPTPRSTKPLTKEERYAKLKEQLQTIGQLRDEGVITQEQYQEQFDKIMTQLDQR